MMAVCPICGKLTCIHWPEHWVFRRGGIYYCGENCLQIQKTRELNILHEAVRKRKEAKEMEKLKKDGTPRMKPGPKKKEKPEVELTIDSGELAKTDTEPEEKVAGMAPAPIMIEDIVMKNVINGFPAEDVTVTAIRMGSLGEFYFDRKYRTIDWRSGTGEEVSLMPDEWRRLAEAIPRMMELLGADN